MRRPETPTASGSARLPALAFIAGALCFAAGGVIVTQADMPPSQHPALGMASHVMWLLAVALVAVGAAVLLHAVAELRANLPGWLAVGVLGLTVLHSLQWVTWAYVDLRAAAHDDYEAFLDAVVSPFGAGHMLMYGVLLGGGIALLAGAFARARLVTPVVAWPGVVVGAVTLLAAGASLVAGLAGGEDGHLLFNIATLLLPLLFVWAVVAGVTLYRSAR